jgi:ribosomal protein L2
VVVISITIVLLTFVVNCYGIPAVSVMEHDPNCSAHIALICYADW